MAPKSSSASAATRKKHAKKSQPQTTKPDPDVPSTANGPKQKKDKKAPKVKRFIPPPTYTGELDPVDIFKIGLHGSPVKPERAVILRKVGKKDPVTIERGLDEWINWINATFNTNSTNLKTDNHRQLHPSEPAELLATVPVLIHHFHRLVVHPSRRVRVLVLTLLDTLISFQYDGDRPCRMALLNPVELEKPEYIGSWIISLWDPDKTARTIANKIWNEIVDLTLEDSALVDGKFKLSDYDSEILHHLFNYIQPSQEGDSQELGTSQTIPRKIAVLSESSESTSCRLRASSFEALAHLLQIHPTPEKMFDQVIHSSIGQRETWELLTPNKIQEPLVRRAIWTLIHTLTSRQVCRPLLDTLLPVFSFLAVDAAFTERNFSVQGTMIIALVGLFKIYPALWWATNQSTSTQSLTAGNEAEDSVRVENGSSSFRHSIIEKFYAFLELGCASNPTLLYPALILIVASFPVTVENANHFFAHFWVALESRALRSSGVQGLNEFYSAWSECLLFFGKKLDDQANPLLQDQLDKIWPQLNDFDHQTDAGFNASSSAIIKVMHQSSFASQYAWSHIGTTVQAEEDERKVLRYLQFLSKARISHPQESPGIKSREASVVLCQRILNHLNSLVEVTDQAAWIPVLTSILKEESAGRTLLESSSIDLLAAFCRDRLPGAVWGGSKPHYNLFLEVLQTAAEGLASPAWIAVMDLDKFSTELTPIKHSILCGILKCAVKSDVNLPTLELDRFVLEYLEQYLAGNLRFQDIIEVILTRPKILIQDETVGRMLSVVVNELHAQTRLLLHSPHPSTQSKLQTVLPMCNLQLKHLDGLSATQQYSILSTLKQCAVDLFSVKSLLPLFGDESVKDLVGIAHEGYSLALQKYPATDLPELHRAIFIILCDCVTDVQCRIHPFDLVEILRDFLGQQHCELDVKDFLRMVPIGDINDNTLASLFSPRKFPPLLPVINCLIHDFPYGEIEVDISLTNKYDRIALAILDLFAQDRQLAQVHLWLWGHCMYIGELARYSSGSSIGGQDHRLSQDELDSIVHAVETTTTYLVSSLSVNVTPTWHGDLVIKMDKPENHIASETDPLKALILSLAIDSRREFIKDLATVALHKVLSTLFKYSDTSANDLKKWQTFLQQIQSSHSNLCLSLIRSLKPYLFTDESFQKYQNRLAAKLTDVPSTQAKTEGLHLIQLLCATAPPPDSAHIFLPQQRAVFLLQAVSGWLSSDDELGHEVNLKLLELYSDLAPIVQTVMGAHWDQMVDLIEINLEEASWEDEDSLLLVWQSCLLIKTLQSIMKHNIALKNYIGPQVQGLLKLVLDLFCSAPLRSTMTATIAPILHVIEDVLNDDEAQSLYSEVPISSLVNSIYSPSIRSSILALTIAQTAVKHLVNNLAVEIELIPESAISPLPEELLNAIQASKYQHPTATLMGWLLVFSYFHNASSRMRNSYSSQLREANLVSENLIPLLHAVLQVAERGKPINISIWDVPSFDFSLLESAMLKPIPLAAYVYFLALRTIPSQIRSWWEDCRNKQLSITVVSFISRQFSPILISHELGKFKEPATLQSLTDENMSIKVSSVIKEVKVTYTVDEESMEIVIRIPSDYPLQPVEVLDIRKVGIPDTTWRAWLLVVQQSIVNHNGSIADAIGLFKKNISLHFEGVEACAICYAIISVVDRSLPSKACRTCRNRFHPSCLYKWFSTSHGSSCPLCRSLF